MKVIPELAEKVEVLRNDISNIEKQKALLEKSTKIYVENISQLKQKYKDLEEKVISDDEFINLLQ